VSALTRPRDAETSASRSQGRGSPVTFAGEHLYLPVTPEAVGEPVVSVVLYAGISMIESAMFGHRKTAAE
jgi:hypothetical protein